MILYVAFAALVWIVWTMVGPWAAIGLLLILFRPVVAGIDGA